MSRRHVLSRSGGMAFALLLGGCAAPAHRAVIRPAGPNGPAVVSDTPNIPDFATKPYEPFSRAAVVAIALREWRLFGQGVDDDPPGTRPPLEDLAKPERQEGLWQRVGEYWYEGMNLDRPEALWTGKHDAFGVEFPWTDDGEYAWSAAFVSYVMRIAGAGGRFPYAPSHDSYIDAARHMADGTATTDWLVIARPIDTYAPRPGDLICTSRTARPIHYRDLPASFPGHCDIVVEVDPGSDLVIGGNVDDAVTAKHIPTLADGRLGAASDQPLDTRYPWFVVLQVNDGQVVSSR